MKKQPFKWVLLTSLLSVWMFSACNSDGNQSTTDSEAMQHQMDSMRMDSIRMANEQMASDMPAEDENYDFSYNYVEDDPTIIEDKAKLPKNKKPTTPAKLKVKEMPVIYTISQTDRPPLFSMDCVSNKNPQKCSNNALADWAKKNVKYPAADLADGSDGLEYVTFVINKKGQVTSINRVDSKKEACDGCSKAVLDAMLDMPDWQPAMLGGNPVNVVVTLPVRFRVL